MTSEPGLETLLREHAPRVLATLVRRYGQQHFSTCEDAVQEALLAAATHWPAGGVPDHPSAWLVTVAANRVTDGLRSDRARREREAAVAASTTPDVLMAPAADEDPAPGDDTLKLLFLCCHTALTPASQVALTLRAVAGLTTAEIAHAFLVPEATMAQRISRAKRQVSRSGRMFRPPTAAERPERVRAVLHVVYLIFSEGHTATAGQRVYRAELIDAAIRLARQAHVLLPDDGEAAGLLALMLLTDARRPARTAPDGTAIPLAEQDRTLWNRDYVTEGVDLVRRTLGRFPVGPYQIQAAIAAVHAEASGAPDTDWPQVLALYELLDRLAPSPMATLNRIVATAMVDGAPEALRLLAVLEDDPRMSGHHRLDAVRAHLLEMAGDAAGAVAGYEGAALRAVNDLDRAYLAAQADRLREEMGRS
ncbi:RNA polymerase sigma factor [Catenulispora subtropica]|uniref:Sigma factor-like helix-turn-helix DNA-binding protein n=1 Tax=Catenulispora subtropica TaxID=450798 RepID=A0ABP5EG93_9ACTN